MSFSATNKGWIKSWALAGCWWMLCGCAGVQPAGKQTLVSSNTKQEIMDPGPGSQYLADNRRLLAGTDFLASGNEPFWSLTFSVDQQMKFTLAGSDSISTPMVQPVLSAGGREARYLASVESGALVVVLYAQPCVNDMSGDTLTHKVTVNFKGRQYKGCGKWLSDYRLHDLWVLESIGGKKPDAAKLKRGLPTFEFNLTTREVMGHTGCNGIGGPLVVQGRFLSMPRLVGTKMACDDDGFERDYLKLLSVEKMPYTINEGRLLLRSGDTELRYRKMD